MADTALFIGWGPIKSGKEKVAEQVFNEVLQFYGSCQQQGRIDAFEPYFLEPHGGDLLGFILVHGDQDKLNQLRYSDEFLRLNDRASVVVDDIGIVAANTGNRLQQLFGNFIKNTSDIT